MTFAKYHGLAKAIYYWCYSKVIEYKIKPNVEQGNNYLVGYSQYNHNLHRKLVNKNCMKATHIAWDINGALDCVYFFVCLAIMITQ